VGTNLIGYRVIEPCQLMQIDLQPPMKISRITQDGIEQDFTQDGNAWFVKLSGTQKQGDT
jgi:hypothetical protein